MFSVRHLWVKPKKAVLEAEGSVRTMIETSIYDLKDISKKLKISIRTLRDYVKKGELKAKLIGRAYYVTEANLIAFLDSES